MRIHRHTDTNGYINDFSSVFFQSVIVGSDAEKTDSAWDITFVELMQSCWATVPKARPSMTDVVKALDRLSPWKLFHVK